MTLKRKVEIIKRKFIHRIINDFGGEHSNNE